MGQSQPIPEWRSYEAPPEMWQTHQVIEMEQTPSSPEEPCDNINTYISKLLREKGIDSIKEWIDTTKEDRFSVLDHLPHVPYGLRKSEKPKPYHPQLVSIGPRYCGMERLELFQLLKDYHYRKVRKLKGPETMKRCYEEMGEKASSWYEVENTEEFGEMLLADGCFVIEVLFHDKLLKECPWINPTTLLGDLLVFENQLPLFWLEELYSIIKDPEDGADFAKLAFQKLNILLPESWKKTDEIPFYIQDTTKIDHLLGLVHHNWVLSRFDSQSQRMVVDRQAVEKGELKVIRCATELDEAGIVFQKNDVNATSLFDVEFNHGTMKIPTLVIDSMTERVFFNLIAYEVRVPHPSSDCVIHYARLMFNLIKKADDVKLLRLSGVIQNNMLADDEAVANMLKTLLDEVFITDDNFLYHKLFDDVNKHCQGPWIQTMASLWHDYLNTPWKRVSFVAGILVFMITVTQLIVALLK